MMMQQGQIVHSSSFLNTPENVHMSDMYVFNAWLEQPAATRFTHTGVSPPPPASKAIVMKPLRECGLLTFLPLGPSHVEEPVRMQVHFMSTL